MARGLQPNMRLPRFLSRIEKAGPDDCWNWSGAKSIDGYGIVYWSSKPKVTMGAHRMMWQIEHGPITDPELCVCHHCDNRLCCNPKHLFLGTRRDNNLDKERKGRGASNVGVKNPRAKLNDDAVREIRRRLADGETQESIAARFGVIQAQIWRIKERITWGHVK